MNIDLDYTAKDIKVVDGLSHVRARPKMYAGSVDSKGVFNLLKEVLNNSIDEAVSGHCTEIKIELHDDDSISIRDNGRGIPIERHSKLDMSILEVIFTKIGACGCGCEKPAGHRQDVNGMGLAPINALSEFLHVETTREDLVGWLSTYRASFAKGSIASSLVEVAPTFSRGTKITFKPDSEIFDDTFLDANIVEAHIDKLQETLKIPLSIELEY